MRKVGGQQCAAREGGSATHLLHGNEGAEVVVLPDVRALVSLVNVLQEGGLS